MNRDQKPRISGRGVVTQCPRCLLWYSIYNEAMGYPHVCADPPVWIIDELKEARAARRFKAERDALVKALEEIETLSDHCINDECYGGEEALCDLLSIRHVIKQVSVDMRETR